LYHMNSLGASAHGQAFGSVLNRPATSYSVEKQHSFNFERQSVTAGCSRQLMESLNQRRPSLQRLHTPFLGSTRFKQDTCRSNCSDFATVNDSVLKNEFSAMQDRKFWESLLRFIDDISTTIQNEDLEQLHKILYFDQGNLPHSPSRFFRSATTFCGHEYLGSGFGGDQQFDFESSGDADQKHSGEFRQVLGEIFLFFENFFPNLRWDFKRQVQEEDALQQLLIRHGTKVVAAPKVVHEEHTLLEGQPVKHSARYMLQAKVEAERAERAENARLLQEGKVKAIQQTPLQMRCSKFRHQLSNHSHHSRKCSSLF
jgi:hypothetical protein